MRMITALIETAKSPLAAAYLYGFVAIFAAFALNSPLLLFIGVASVGFALLAAIVLSAVEELTDA